MSNFSPAVDRIASHLSGLYIQTEMLRLWMNAGNVQRVSLGQRVYRYRSALSACIFFLLFLPSPSRSQHTEWDTLNSRALKFLAKGQYTDADGAAEKTLLAAKSAFIANDSRFATSLNTLARAKQFLAKYETADSLFRAALSIDERQGTTLPTLRGIVRDLNDLAELALETFAPSTAESLLNRSLVLQSSNDRGRLYRQTLSKLLDAHRIQKHCREAEELVEKLNAQHRSPTNQQNPGEADVELRLGELQYDIGRYKAADSLFNQAYDAYATLLGAEHPVTAHCLILIAAVQEALGQYESAIILYERAGVILEKALQPNDLRKADLLKNLGFLYVHTGKWGRGLETLNHALRIYQSHRKFCISQVILVSKVLADRYCATCQCNLGDSLYTSLGIQDPEAADSALICPGRDIMRKGVKFWDNGRLPEAESANQEAISYFQDKFGPYSPLLILPIENLVVTISTPKRYAEVERLYWRAFRIAIRAYGQHHPTVDDLRDNLRRSQFDQNKARSVDLYLGEDQ